MNDCHQCLVEPFCHYPYKPCDCFDLRKFWTENRRAEWNKQQTRPADQPGEAP